MSKFMKLEVEGKDYLVGFSNRFSVLNAKRQGMEKTLQEMDKIKDTDEGIAKLLRYGLMEKQPEITEKQAKDILDKYIEENVNDEECVDISQIVNFINEQYLAFSGLPTGKKKVKIIEIVEG